MAYTVSPVDDKAVWELFVLKHSPVALFQSWMWGQVQESLKLPVMRMGLWHNKELVGVFQTVHVRAKRGSFLHVRHGPIVATKDLRAWKAIFSYLVKEAQKSSCFFIRINPLLPDGESFPSTGLRFFSAAIHRMDGERCWILDVNQDQETLLANMRKTTRYEIKRAQKAGVEVVSTTNSKFLTEFFRLYDLTSKRHGFVPHLGIAEEFEIFSKKGQAVLYLGKFDNTVYAAAIVLYYGNQAIYHHGASLQAPYPVSTLVQWHAILDAQKRGMKVYNFWGIAPDGSTRHPWRGITLFKKGFGGREINYIHAQDHPITWKYLVPRTIETVRRVMKGYD